MDGRDDAAELTEAGVEPSPAASRGVSCEPSNAPGRSGNSLNER